MSLPDAPNTLREKYYSVMAGQNDADILPDIETAPSTENRYLDYIARNGGGGGGDVTKAYVDEQDAKKTDKVTSATSGNFAGLDSNGNLTDSNKSAADFATASDMTAVQGVIPSAATTSNKLSTAADTAAEEIASTAIGVSIILTDSADARVQGLTIYGQSEVVEGEIKSVGDDGLTVTTANSNNTLTTSAEFTTALPLRGVSDTVRDKLTCTAESKQVETVCGEVNLGTTDNWGVAGEAANTYYLTLNEPTLEIKPYTTNVLLSTTKYQYVPTSQIATDKSYTIQNKNILIHDNDYTNVTAFKSSLSGVHLIYELATPVTTPLTSAEIAAFRSLRTYDSTTNIDATDAPTMTVDYLLNTNNGKAVSKVNERVVNQMLSLIAAPYNETATYAQGAYCTYLGTLYKSTTAIGTAEPFNPSHWTATTIMAEI